MFINLMKKKFLLFLLLTSCLCAEEKKECPKNSTIYFGPQVSYLELDIAQNESIQFANGDQNVKLDGPVGGASFIYQYKKLHSFYAALKSSFFGGSLSGSNVSSRTIYDVDTKACMGYNYFALQGRDLIVSPYLGLGYWYVRQSKGEVFEYLHTYLPIGFIVDYHVLNWLHTSMLFEWMPDLDSNLKVSSLPDEKWILSNELGQFTLEFSVEMLLGSRNQWNISINPFWMRRKDGATIDPLMLALPEQTYSYWGGRVFCSYHF